MSAETAIAAPDYDRDGAAAGDCAPLDPAVHPGASDRPDLWFEDTNCDGIDGDISQAVFVSSLGDDDATGSKDAPKKTIAAAIDRAEELGKTQLYVASGDYREDTPVDLADNLGIYGGYTHGTWSRTTSVIEPTRVASAPEAMVADDDQGVVLQLLRLKGLQGVGKNVYGLRAVNNSTVALSRVNVAAEDGAPGTSFGQPGQPLKQSAGAPGTSGSCSDGGVGGAGGFGAFNGSARNNGGNGGRGGNNGAAGGDGVKGTGNAGGSGGQPGGISGNRGQAGAAGAPGGGGLPGPAGANANSRLDLARDTWMGADGARGSDGTPGSGGGGGGGGHGTSAGWGFEYHAAGGGGGGGGGGGIGGSGGSGGTHGGGSFGVYLWNASVVVSDGSSVTAGAGGDGGHGAPAGAGGDGGEGGPGGPQGNCGISAGNGGHGGKGGRGGDGGSGGGGSGGPSAGIFTAGSSEFVVRNDSTLAAGDPGAGGRLGATGPSATQGHAAPVVPFMAGNSPTSDFDGDGVTDQDDSCADVAGTTATEGCPARAPKLPDTDGDGVPNGVDKCSSMPAGSRDADEDGCPDPEPPRDADGDGYSPPADCDDANASLHPGAVDTPDNAIDEDCDGVDHRNPDRDGDGYDRAGVPGVKAPYDCDDANRRINPGARDVPRNGVDEDCDGRDADYLSITSEVRYLATHKRGFAIIRRLSVIRPPDGASVELRCRGKGCTFKRRRKVAAPGTREMAVGVELRKAKLRRGAMIEVWITRAGMRGKVVRLRVGRRGRVTGVTLCVLPGSKTPTGCPAA